ncbi:hypothetical protein LCGC14_1246470, partial [marine sediment metagenome]
NPEVEFDIDITEFFESDNKYLEQIKLDLYYNGEIEFDDAFLFSQYALLEENYNFYFRNEYLDFEKFSLVNDEIILSRGEIDRLLFHDIDNNKYYIRAKLEYNWNVILEMNLGSNSKLDIISTLNLIKYDLFTAYTSYETTRISAQKINTSYELVKILAPNYFETDSGITVLPDDDESDIGIFGGFLRNIDTKQRLLLRQQLFYNFSSSPSETHNILLDHAYTDSILRFVEPNGWLEYPSSTILYDEYGNRLNPPLQPNDFDFTYGALTNQGDIEGINGDYSNITSTTSGQFYPPTVEMPINTDFSTSITIPAGAFEYLDNSFATITAGISSTTYPPGFVVPLQGEFTFTKGGWGSYNALNLETINGQYTTIASASSTVYDNSIEVPIAGEFSGTGDLTYQNNLGTIDTPYTTIGGVSDVNYINDLRSGPNEWNNWSWTYGSGSTDYGTLTNNDGGTNRIDAGLSSVGPGTQIDHGDSYPDGSTPTYVNLYDVPTSGEFSGIGDLTYQGDLGTIGAPYTTISAVNNPGIIGDQRASPHEWNDWTWTYGSGSTDYGTLTSNDGDTNRIDAESFPGTVSDTGPIHPDDDVYNNPNFPSPGYSSWISSPLWSKINSFGSGYIYGSALPGWEADAAVTIEDVTIPAGNYVTKIDLSVFGYYINGPDAIFRVSYRIGTGSWSSAKDVHFTSSGPGYKFALWDNLWRNQYNDADMDDLQIRLWYDNYATPFPPPDEQVVDYLQVVISYAPEIYQHIYGIKLDINDGSMSSIQNLRYEWQQTAARNTKMYIYDGSNYQTLVNDRGSSTAYYTGSWALTSPYIQNGDEVWLYIVSAPGVDFDIRFDQLYIEYSILAADYEISKIVEWNALGAAVMDTLTYDHDDATVAFEIFDYTTGYWESITGSPFTLGPEHVSGGDTIKVRYSKSSSSSFTLNIDQLRVDFRDGWSVSPSGHNRFFDG